MEPPDGRGSRRDDAFVNEAVTARLGPQTGRQPQTGCRSGDRAISSGELIFDDGWTRIYGRVPLRGVVRDRVRARRVDREGESEGGCRALCTGSITGGARGSSSDGWTRALPCHAGSTTALGGGATRPGSGGDGASHCAADILASTCRLDVLVNNACGVDSFQGVGELPDEIWGAR